VFDRHLADLRPDIVAWWSMGCLSLSLLARASSEAMPSVAFVHDDWLLYGPVVDQWLRQFARRPRLGAVVERRMGLPTRFATETVTRWLFVSDFTRLRAVESGLPLRDIGVAHSGIEASFIGPAPGREWRGRLLYVGRIDERKGIADAVSTLPAVSEQSTLTIVGDGDDGHLKELHRFVAQLDLVGRVRFRGGVSRAELRAIYDSHDALLFPVSWDEPWGLVPLEAMARGVPVVATGRGGSAEYLRDDHNCLLYTAGDVASMAAAVRCLADDAALRGRLRAGGITTAARHSEDSFNRLVAGELEQVASAGIA
jgi:glycosyltransferase involved in cell wall biosynthesis